MIAESAMAGEAPNLAQEALAQKDLARQEENLLETAVREHARLVYRIAYSVLRNPADAEDATQEIFLRVLHYEKKCPGFMTRKRGWQGLHGAWPPPMRRLGARVWRGQRLVLRKSGRR